MVAASVIQQPTQTHQSKSSTKQATHRVHPNECLPVLCVADVNQPVQFSWTDAVCNELNVC